MSVPAAAATIVPLASPGRRLGGFLLEMILAALTLGIGWLIWYLFVANHGQSPAKRLLGMRVIRKDGTVANIGWMLLRDIGLKAGAFLVLSLILRAIAGGAAGTIFFIVFAVAALWCVWDANRQCLWDKVLGTRVIPASSAVVAGGPGFDVVTDEAAENLRTLAELHSRGLLTDAEYEERRAREIERR